MRKNVGFVALATLAAGCTLIPHYERPAPPIDDHYRSEPAPAGGVTPSSPDTVRASDIGWREFFKDPTLQRLVEMSLMNNPNLRVAVLNVAASEALYRVQFAGLFPTLDATAAGDFERSAPGQSGFAAPVKIHSYSVGLSMMSYELDLFGKIRSRSKQAQEQYLSSAESRQTTQIALVASVASYYLAWLADQDAIRVSEQTVISQQRSFELREMTLQEGTGTILDVSQAESTLRTAQATLQQYTRQSSQDLDELVLLVGAPLPETLLNDEKKQSGLMSQSPFPSIPAGLPAELLARRPDIRAAEHTLLAANANIGAARAAFFPSVTLTASGGSASGTLNQLFKPGTATWAFQPQISLPIFDGGLNSANLDYAKIEKRIEIANYEAAIQSAFHDVSYALAGRATYRQQIEAEEQLVNADARYYTTSQMRFDAGVDTFLNVLVAQSSLFSAQIDLINLRLLEQQNLVTLYKALGGGWTERAPTDEAAANH